MSLPISKYHFSVVEFERMGKAGVFTEDARLALIEGEIIEMSPIDSHHAACVKFHDAGYDRQVKVPLYARAGVMEAWIVNLAEEQIETYSGRADGSYQTIANFRRGEEARAHTIARLSVPVADVLR